MDESSRCMRCAVETNSWDLVNGFCEKCLVWIEENPEEAKAEITDMWGDLAHYELYGKAEAEKSLDRLAKTAAKLRKGMDKFRAFLAEKGYELTHEQLQEVLEAMDDMKIKVAPESVLEFMKSWKTDD